MANVQKRKRGPTTRGYVQIHVRIPPSVDAALAHHAWKMNRMPVAVLIRDLLQAYCAVSTDPKDPFFSERSMGCKIPPLPVERFPGYLDCLGYVLADDDA